jgi:hypothetical protein
MCRDWYFSRVSTLDVSDTYVCPHASVKENYPLQTYFCRFYAHCRHEPSGTAGDLPGTAPRIQQVIVLSILIEYKKIVYKIVRPFLTF